jgi:hypothetical protein
VAAATHGSDYRLMGFAQKAAFVLFRVISWIDFGVRRKAIHELTRTKTKIDATYT